MESTENTKKIVVTNASVAIETGGNGDRRLCCFEIEGPEDMEASDGSHTFAELYEHRYLLFIALCRYLAQFADAVLFTDGLIPRDLKPWRSRLHADGTMFPNYFILGVSKKPGKIITYHLPITYWEETEFAETLDNAPEWDGHTPTDVLERIKNI